MKEIPRSRGVRYPDLVGGSIPEAVSIPCEGSIHSDGRAKCAEIVLEMNLRQGLQKFFFPSGIEWELLGSDWIVYEVQEPRQPWVHVIKVCDNRNSGGASPGGGHARGSGIVTIHVQETAGSYPASLEERRRNG
jgi:hypothetical protein